MRIAMAAGLRLDPVSSRRGYEDGLRGISRITAADLRGGSDVDVLAYLRGWLEARKRKGG